MKKCLIFAFVIELMLAGCANEYNKVYKTPNVAYKYEYAKECFAKGKYGRAAIFLSEVITLFKNTSNAEESLYMLAMSQYMDRDYESAAQTFRKYYQTYPRGYYREMAAFYVGQSLYMSTPEPRLDQTQTVSAIAAFQEYLDVFVDAKYKSVAQDRLFELQDKLVKKELYSAQLYYDLGSYFGNCGYGGTGTGVV